MNKLIPARKILQAVVVVSCFFSAHAQGSRRVIARASSEPESKAPAPAAAKKAPVKKSSAPAPRRAARPKPLPTYGDPTAGDDASRDDPVVRAAAVAALGKLMGSVVVVDPHSGRVLAVVNQKLAFSDGYQPCSTFKPAVALAALQEHVIEQDRNQLQLGKKLHLSLQEALAISNNLYFEKLGQLLGLEKLRQYAQQFGLGEPAGWEIEQEPPGAFPEIAPPKSKGGVGRIASFGQGISMTMFQLASFLSALSNGGTLYYLQYPRNNRDLDGFEPRVKRELELATWISPVQQGMESAVLTGTAKRARQPDVQILGKTGTCSQNGARLGWFAGYSQQKGGLVVVVLLRSGKSLGGGAGASQVAGKLFRKLADQSYLAETPRKTLDVAPPAAIQMPALR